jgi:hypothetical protein
MIRLHGMPGQVRHPGLLACGQVETGPDSAEAAYVASGHPSPHRA